MRASGAVWRIQLRTADAALADRAVAALEPVCRAVSAFEESGGGAWLVEGFSEVPLAGVKLATMLELAWAGRGPAPKPVIEKLPARDWVRENQESFPPRRVGRYFIHGSHHLGGIPAGAIGLLIDAATAFGTGEHASTEGCIRALDGLARRRRFRRVLDMGTGTGILAIAAAKTFGRGVLAADIDRGSVRVARENARRNGVARHIAACESAGYRSRRIRSSRPYDLVLANILARPLALMAPDLRRALAPGGLAVLAGLIDWQEPYVLAAHRAQRLSLVRRITVDGWRTLVLRRARIEPTEEEEKDP